MGTQTPRVLGAVASAERIVLFGSTTRGDGGGLIVAEGPPEAVMEVAASHTGRALAARRSIS